MPGWLVCKQMYFVRLLRRYSVFVFCMVRTFEPAHEIMTLFVLRKPILQTRMHSLLVGLDVWFLVGPFVYFHTSCVRTAKALARLRGCAGSPEHSLVACVISTTCDKSDELAHLWKFFVLDKFPNKPYLHVNCIRHYFIHSDAIV